jgi:two-component system OmpR family response regulator
VLSAGDLVYDPLTRRCTRGDDAIALTPRELGLLEALLSKPGEVVAKRDLLMAVWGADFDGDANVVEVYIRYLRRKIDEPYGRHSLRTVRGHGYQLIDDGRVDA